MQQLTYTRDNCTMRSGRTNRFLSCWLGPSPVLGWNNFVQWLPSWVWALVVLKNDTVCGGGRGLLGARGQCREDPHAIVFEFKRHWAKYAGIVDDVTLFQLLFSLSPPCQCPGRRGSYREIQLGLLFTQETSGKVCVKTIACSLCWLLYGISLCADSGAGCLLLGVQSVVVVFLFHNKLTK